MSPAPATATARRQAGRSRTVTRSPVPRAPRRVSGPTRRVAAPAVAGRPVALPRPAVGAGLGAWVRSLPDHRLLDRLIRGRTWIVLIAVLLAGIVAVQVSMLKLNAGISRAVEHAQLLQRQNQQMQASVAALGSDSRMQALAEAMGFHTPTAGSERYLSVGAGDARRAARGMKPPQPHTTTTTTAPAATTTTATQTPATSGTTGAATPGATTGTGAASSGVTGTAATGTGTTSGGTGAAGPATGTTGGTGTGTGTPIAPPTSGTTGTGTTGTGNTSGGAGSG